MGILGPLDPVLTQALSAPSGPDDSGWHTGIVRSWDESSNTNVVEVNGIALTNLKSSQTGIGVTYGAGDNVLILRKQTQYVVMGKMSVPGAALPDQIRYAEISQLETTASTSYVDLATVGPTLDDVLIGSSRRFLLITNIFVKALNLVANLPSQSIGGFMTVNITGASTIPVVGTVEGSWVIPTNAFGGGTGHYSRMFVMTAANGVNPGLHSFSTKYQSKTAAVACGFANRNITVIPF